MEDHTLEDLELPTLSAAGHSSNPFPGQRTLSRWSALRALSALGSVLYAIRLPDATIKIGCTTRLHQRIGDIACRLGVSASDVEVLAVRPGNLADEAAVHTALAPHRQHGHEYYNPTAEVMAVVNEWREALGRDAIAA